MNQPANSQTSRKALWGLLLDELIDEASGAEVETAKKIMEAFYKGSHRLERKQISNLVAVAGETNSVPIVEDFVRYQMGRDERRQTWRAGQPKALGDAVLEHLEELKVRSKQLVERAARDHLETAPSEGLETAQAKVWAMLTRRFTAYLEHSFTYFKESRRGRGGAA
jgi:hypothetical protein